MSEIRRLVIGETTETVIRTLFDHRIAQESSELDALNRNNRALKIKDLKNQIMSFIKRNPNAVFELVVPEFKSDKVVKIHFTNFDDFEFDLEEEDNFANYNIIVEDNFVNANIVHKVKIGKDITLKIKAE